MKFREKNIEICLPVSFYICLHLKMHIFAFFSVGIFFMRKMPGLPRRKCGWHILNPGLTFQKVLPPLINDYLHKSWILVLFTKVLPELL